MLFSKLISQKDELLQVKRPSAETDSFPRLSSNREGASDKKESPTFNQDSEWSTADFDDHQSRIGRLYREIIASRKELANEFVNYDKALKDALIQAKDSMGT